jgi:hypothetical protein
MTLLEGEAFEDENNEGPDLKNEVMDINVERFFDVFLGKMTDVEKLFALIEVGCSEKYETVTAFQLSVDSMFYDCCQCKIFEEYSGWRCRNQETKSSDIQ